MMRRITVLMLVLLALIGCGNEPKLVIIHTNDTHSHFEPLRTGPQTGQGGVIERAAFIDSVRAVYGDGRVLLLHAGDFGQGTSYFTELDGRLEPAVINDMRYDCITLGNHEFDNDIEDLTGRLAMLGNTSVISANIDVSQFDLANYVKPYAIVERGGMRIGIIGLESDLSTNVSATVASRFAQLDNVEVTNRWAEHLHTTEKCDMIILLSHLGYDNDRELVPQIRHIDLVIGGHSHTFVDGFIYVTDRDGHQVPIITDGCWGLEMGVVTVR